MRIFIAILFLIVVSLIDLAFTPYFSLFHIKPYAIILFLYFFTLKFSPLSALIVAGFTGFLYDIFAPDWFGLHIIAFSTFVYVEIALRDRVYWERMISLLFLFAGAFFIRLVVDVPFYAGFLKAFTSVFTSALPGALINLLAGLVVKIIIDAKQKNAI